MSGSISNNYQHIIDLFRDILSQKETVNIPYALGMWLKLAFLKTPHTLFHRPMFLFSLLAHC